MAKNANQELIDAIRDLAEQERQAAIRQEAFNQLHGIGPEGPVLPYQLPQGPMMDHRAPSVGGGGGFDAGEAAGGIGLGLAKTTADYAGARTPYGTTGNTDMLGQNLEMGMLKGLADLGGQTPGVGSWIENQYKGLEEAVYAPEQRARGRLTGTFERFAQAGIDVSDKEIEQAFQYAIPIERRGVYMKQRLERIGAAVNAENGSALSGALSQLGL